MLDADVQVSCEIALDGCSDHMTELAGAIASTAVLDPIWFKSNQIGLIWGKEIKHLYSAAQTVFENINMHGDLRRGVSLKCFHEEVNGIAELKVVISNFLPLVPRENGHRRGLANIKEEIEDALCGTVAKSIQGDQFTLTQSFPIDLLPLSGGS